MNSTDRSKLAEVFSQAQGRGWIGGRDIDQHIDHSLAFASVAAAVPTFAVDLGSGGGLPALVLAAAWPHSRWALVESSLPKAAFLELQCARLGWSDRVVIRHTTVQGLGEEQAYRHQADLVTARSFGHYSLVVEAAAPLLRLGGELVASASPDATTWPFNELAALGMGPDRLTRTTPKFHRATQLAPIPR